MFSLKRTIVLSFILPFLAAANEASAEESLPSDGRRFPSANVLFRKGISKLELDYKDNLSALDSITAAVYRIMVDDFENLKAIEITTAASPEGIYELNIKLANERAQSIKDYLLEKLPLKNHYYWIRPLGEDWDGLYKQVKTTDNKWRDRILGAILASNVLTVPSKETSDDCIAGLKGIDNGKAWQWLNSEIFPRLRNGIGNIRCVFRQQGERQDDSLSANAGSQTRMPQAGVARVLVSGLSVSGNGATGMGVNGMSADGNGAVGTGVAGADGLAGIAAGVNGADAGAAGKSRKRSMADDAETSRLSESVYAKRFRRDTLFRTPVVAIRSNLLVPLTNIGIEVPISNRWSIEADWYSPWVYRNWLNSKFPKNENCFQVQMAYLCGRIWLGTMHSDIDGNTLYRLRGHSIGFGAGAFRYDIGFNNEGQQGKGLALGTDYQYALPLGKGGAHLEFSLGICLCYRYYQDYKVEMEYTEDDKTIRVGSLFSDNAGKSNVMIAPFKASVNLVVPIFTR